MHVPIIRMYIGKYWLQTLDKLRKKGKSCGEEMIFLIRHPRDSFEKYTF